LRKFVQREHSEDGARRSAKNRRLEGDRDECGPAIQGTAGDIQRIRDYVDPILKEKPTKSAAEAAEERQLRNQIVLPTLETVMKAHCFGKAGDWERSKSVKVLVARFTDFPRS